MSPLSRRGAAASGFDGQGGKMSKHQTIWAGVIGAGVLATILGFGALDLGQQNSDATAAAAFTALLLLTAGLGSCMAGVLGLSGLMEWIPGLGESGDALSRME